MPRPFLVRDIDVLGRCRPTLERSAKARHLQGETIELDLDAVSIGHANYWAHREELPVCGGQPA
jgi:hypothetical protein